MYAVIMYGSSVCYRPSVITGMQFFPESWDNMLFSKWMLDRKYDRYYRQVADLCAKAPALSVV